MVGSNCAIVGCAAKRSKNRGLSFHELPKGKDDEEWRKQLIRAIDRSDKSFNPSRAVICSRHFSASCFRSTGNFKLKPVYVILPVPTPQARIRDRADRAGVELAALLHKMFNATERPSGHVRYLIKGSLPTEFMPAKSIQLPKPAERKPPTHRETSPVKKRVFYYGLGDVRKDAVKLQIPWIVLEDSPEQLTLGLIEKCDFRMHVFVQSTLSASVTVYGMPAKQLTRNIEDIRLKDYLLTLTNLNTCTGINTPHLQQYGKLPSNKFENYYLHITGYFWAEEQIKFHSSIRSKHCYLLSPENICMYCKEVGKLLVLKQKRAEKNASQPLKLHEPLLAASRQKLKAAVKNLRQCEKKLRKENEKFKAMLKTESISISQELHDNLKTVIDENTPSEPLGRLFWQEQQKAFKSSAKGFRWHPMMLRLAILIHSRSAQAYKTLRDTGVLRLPCESTLRDYTNYMHPKCGFQEEVLKEIKAAADKLDDIQKHVVLLHDEMSIKEDLVFDSKTGELVGFINLNQWQAFQEVNTVANHVLVFYVVGICSSLKGSLGFFGTRSITANHLYPLFWQAVGYLEETCGLKVIASTSDKASCNQRFYQLHGNSNAVCFKTVNYFAMERYIYFFSDPPHLIKTVRNNIFRSGFGDQKSMLLWNNGQYILWKHIADAYHFDRTNVLHRTKLTNEHINLTGHSMMNVKLAAQVLSRSVGLVLQNYGGPECQTTSSFVLLMDRFFDCLNVSCRTEGVEKRKQDLMPYTDVNDPRFTFLQEEFLGYLADWRQSVLTRPGQYTTLQRSKMFLTHQTFKGLEMTVRSFVEATQYLLNIGASYVLSNKFCQDPLESHFSRHRGLGRRNENPSLYSFGYQENKLRLQRTLALTIQTAGNVSKRKRRNNVVTISNSPLKKAKR